MVTLSLVVVLSVPVCAAGRSRAGKHHDPLVPAMLLVLAGYGISMLFDRRD